jgi:hypothetical protein
MEDPVYKMYRQQYHGYHPTCWRRFPSGWGCPSPEAPDPVKSFKDLPRDAVTPPDTGDDRGPGMNGDDAGPPRGRGPGNGAAPGLNPNNLPLPADRSPFEMDTKPDAAPGNGARAPSARPSGAAAPTPTPAPAPNNNDGGGGVPPLAEPTVGGPSALNAPAVNARPRLVEPILSVPDPTVGLSSAYADPAPPPAQAPRRPGFLSGLFGGGSMFRR